MAAESGKERESRSEGLQCSTQETNGLFLHFVRKKKKARTQMNELIKTSGMDSDLNLKCDHFSLLMRRKTSEVICKVLQFTFNKCRAEA